MELTKNEMYSIDGGGISWGIVAGIAAAVVYIIGCFNGYTNPSKCSN
jgi:lactobin A/cerein 7B family class IIb bacteriocin